MTREEAIRMLVRLKERINFEVTDAQGKMDALNMAIKSLEQETYESGVMNDKGKGNKYGKG